MHILHVAYQVYPIRMIRTRERREYLDLTPVYKALHVVQSTPAYYAGVLCTT